MEKSTTKQLRSEIDKLNNTIADFKNAFDISPGLICVANAKTGQFSECNPAVKRILGFTVEEFTSRPFKEFVHPDDWQKTIDVVTEQLKGKPVANFQNRYLCKDGTYKWLAWQATSADKNGKVYAVATNINDLKKAENDLRKRLNELEIWNDVTVDRELKMLELKKEINELLEKLHKNPKYKIPI